MVVPPTRISVSFPQPATHLLQVEVLTPGLAAGDHEFFMPVWTPGSYLVREYSRHVEAVEAADGRGRPLACAKSAKNRWRVRLDSAGDVRLGYRVYARDLTVRTNFVDQQRAYWNGAATYIVAAERRDAPVEVEVSARAGWTVHTGLTAADGVFVAPTFDEAVDAPFFVGSAAATAFDACGARHECVLDGVAPAERDKLTADIAALVESAAAIFGGRVPYDRYLFIVFADRSGGGGLEHANSCVVHVARASLRKPEARLELLGLFAHEFFHVWNVKRIRPEALARFDWEGENYTRDLWLAEGFTSYYQEVIPYAAGRYTRAFFLDRLARNHDAVLSVPGRRLQSVSDASFDAWIKLYRPDETTRNTTVSYYGKGALVAFCLDLLIQSGSGGRRSLDDVMRGLWADFRERGPGQTRALVGAVASEAAGRDLGAELADLLDGTDDPPLADWLAPFGLRYVPPSGAVRPCLDIATGIENGVLVVKRVDRGGAGYAMGLSPGDELVAIDDDRVLPGDWDATLRDQYAPGQEVEIQLFRRGLLASVAGRLGARTEGKPKIVEEGGALRFRP